MVTQNMVVGLPKVLPPDGLYRDGCVLAKHHQAPFNSRNAWHAHKPLDLVRNDLHCINIPSLASVKYILTFISDLSRFT